MAFVPPTPVLSTRSADNLPRTSYCPVQASASVRVDPRKPRTVGIAGAGIAGLSTALALLARPQTGVKEVVLFEPRQKVDIGVGGALNLNSGAAVLAKSYGLGPKLWKIANPLRRVRSVVADGSPTGGDVLLDLDIERLILRSQRSRELLVHDDKVVLMTVMRDLFQQLLVDALPDAARIERGKKVVGVIPNGNKYRFRFHDGSASQQFDMVIGADGIRSAVRKYLHPSEAPPIYSGIQIQFAVSAPGRSAKNQSEPRGTAYQYFGDGAYALAYTAGGDATQEQDLVALCFESNKSTDENEGYDAADIQSDCKLRLEESGIVQDHVRDCVEHAARFIQVGVYYHRSVSRWSDLSGGCVILGDAAHAMPPFLGAGAGQAIQDAHALALSLSKVGDSYASVGDAVRAFESSRQPPTAAIMQTSRIIGKLETQGGFGAIVRNNLFRVMSATGLAGQVYLASATPQVEI